MVREGLIKKSAYSSSELPRRDLKEMLGAIAGGIIGSVHEFQAPKHSDFPLFTEGSRYTDDSILTVAVAHCLLTGCNYVDSFTSMHTLTPIAVTEQVSGTG